MWNKVLITICVALCFTFSALPSVVAQIKLKTRPELNSSLPLKKRELKKNISGLMTGSGGLEPSFPVEFEGIRYLVAVPYGINKISFISTTDKRFKTDEGIMVGDTLQKVIETSKGKLIREPGWAFFVRLGSG